MSEIQIFNEKNMNITKDKITEIFYLTDEFCINFKKSIQGHNLGYAPKKKPIMSESEVITLMVLFHLGAFRNLKHFYLFYVQVHLLLEST